MKPFRDLVFWYLKKKNLVPASGDLVATVGRGPAIAMLTGPPGKQILSLAPEQLHSPEWAGASMVPLMQSASFAGALGRLKKRELQLGTIIDVGASDGRWSAQLLQLYPKARYLCIEAQSEHEPALRAFAKAHPQVEYVICAAGARQGQVQFNATELFGGAVLDSVSAHPPQRCITVPVNTIDALIAERQLPPPYLIKLDTHGYELPILAGAQAALKQTEALFIEVYNFPGGPPAVPFYEFCAQMATQGFRCVDLLDPLYRTHDGALWQMDLVFLRASRPEFKYVKYA